MQTKNIQIFNSCSNTDEQLLALLQGKKTDDKKTRNRKKLKHEWSQSKHTVS